MTLYWDQWSANGKGAAALALNNQNLISDVSTASPYDQAQLFSAFYIGIKNLRTSLGAHILERF